MTHILGHDRSQLLLLPEAVDDYVGAENPVRFIDALVDGLISQRSGLSARCQRRQAVRATLPPTC